MAAFNNSPGGCCCGAPGWFDIYGYNFAELQASLQPGLRRVGSVRPENSPFPYDSFTSFGWGIPNAPHGQLGAHRSFTRDGRTVWTIEEYIVGGSTPENTYIGCYDAPTQTQRLSVPILQLYFAAGYVTPLFTGRQSIAIADGILAQYFSGLRTLSIGGTIDNWGDLLAWQSTQGSVTTTIVKDLAAGLQWPRFPAILRLASSSPRVDLVIGDIAKPAAGTDTIQLGNTTTVRSMTAAGEQGQFIGFDQLNNDWATTTTNGYLDFQGRLRQRDVQLSIDGQVIWTRRMPDRKLFSDPYTLFYPEMQPHICYPHEQLGAGYVALPETHWITTSDQTTATSIYHTMTVYRSGVQVWTTPQFNNPIAILGSTDRWIYFTTPSGVNVSTMTGGRLSMPNDPGTSQLWLAKHDGSEIVPMGTVLNSHGQMNGLSESGIPFDSMVRDSSVVPGTIPGSYEEMWASRNTI